MADPLRFNDFLTVGELRRAMRDLPDDAPVVYQRIEDTYFTQDGWQTVDRPSLDVPTQTTGYIRAYWAGSRGERVLFIDAHY